MPLTVDDQRVQSWRIDKIAVVGPGIVGMPMAALLADAGVREGTDQPAPVLVVQRGSRTSGWKVDAINAGRSPIGGVEPGLDAIVTRAHERGLLRATTDVAEVRDADVILVCVQTDRDGYGPAYGPLLEALHGIAAALRERPVGNVPLVVFESTLAPSSMQTVVRPLFAEYGLEEGRDVLLGNSPNRVMPGRLVERVAASDKLVAGLHPATPTLIARLYGRIVTGGTLLQTNSLTAEVVKTLENAYRDVRIAYAAEVVRHCDTHDVDFFAVREWANAALRRGDGATADPRAVPTGAMLVPTVGVGGHCLPKDGILLWWRALQAGVDPAHSLLLTARTINDESPAHVIALAERRFGPLAGRRAAVIGVAYRFDSEDTRNSPSLVLARELCARGCDVVLQDPHVLDRDQNLERTGLAAHFTRDLDEALASAELVFLCTAHAAYQERAGAFATAPRLAGLIDACNFFDRAGRAALAGRYAGIGRGTGAPDESLVAAVVDGFRAVERGVANEVAWLADFLTEHYGVDTFNRVSYAEVQRLARTCGTGCDLADPGPPLAVPDHAGFVSRLVDVAAGVRAPTDSVAAPLVLA